MARGAKAAVAAIGREEVVMPVRDLLDNPRNARLHAEEQIDRLMASLRTDGQTKPVLARRENFMLIAGHGVTQAARRLGWDMLTVVLLDVTQERADRMMLGDNRQGELSTSDAAKVATLLREVDDADYMATGYSDDEVEKLLRPADVSDLKVVEIDVSDRHDQFWISVSGPLPDQALALQRIKVLMAEMPKVSVVLGTTDDLS